MCVCVFFFLAASMNIMHANVTVIFNAAYIIEESALFYTYFFVWITEIEILSKLRQFSNYNIYSFVRLFSSLFLFLIQIEFHSVAVAALLLFAITNFLIHSLLLFLDFLLKHILQCDIAFGLLKLHKPQSLFELIILFEWYFFCLFACLFHFAIGSPMRVSELLSLKIKKEDQHLVGIHKSWMVLWPRVHSTTRWSINANANANEYIDVTLTTTTFRRQQQ